MDQRKLANVIRVLAADACEAANSGHPGMPLGMADIASVLWQKYLRHNPKNPKWLNRDRFIMSNGHGSMLQYALLHLSGYAVSLDDLKNFRQLGAITAGHPEVDECPGIETTTGPLGQGLGNAVGLALAYRHLAARYNQPNFTLFDPKVYVTVGDGCLMEGISHEVCALAGVHQLDNLVAIYDANGISIDGEIDGWMNEDVAKRFSAYGWEVIGPIDGHNFSEIDQALAKAQANLGRPKLIIARTIIGQGAPNKKNTSGVHGAPLGTEEIQAMRAALDWPHPSFHIPKDIYAEWSALERGQAAEADWQKTWQAYQTAHPQSAHSLVRIQEGKFINDLDAVWDALTSEALSQDSAIATRKTSLMVLKAIHPHLPELIGGSADLTGSNCTLAPSIQTLSAEQPDGQYIYYGVREFGMMAMTSGIALSGLLIPYSATFLVFSDYARNAIRMAALMKLRNIFVLTHDSVALGEDGPTHQPVEHISSLRLIPNLAVWRPADLFETVCAWKAALEHKNGPTVLVLSRQNLAALPACQRSVAQVVAQGAYAVLAPSNPDLALIATGSEVELAVQAAERLDQLGHKARVISMPCVEAFQKLSTAEQAKILGPASLPKLVIEAGASQLWPGLLSQQVTVVGLNQFGTSGPGKEVLAHYNFTPEAIAQKAQAMIGPTKN